MGLFSFVGKALGKVAKAGLSIVTHGASDKVLSVLKSRQGKLNEGQKEALLAKVGPPAMRVARTESSSVEGYGYGRSPKTQRTPKRKPRQSRAAAQQDYQLDGSEPDELPVLRAPKRRKKGSGSPAKARSKRKPPKGGLDLARISQLWKAAGKPGSWQDWIKSHSNVRVA